MAQHKFINHIIFGSLIIVGSGFAHADVVQCVDERGAITYTNVSCEADTEVNRSPASINSAFQIRKNDQSQADTLNPTRPAQERAATKMSANRRGLALDVATMKSARSSLLLMDQASYLSRQQKVAALDQNAKDQRWFKF